MTGRRPTDAGDAGPLTGPTIVSPFHPERSSPPRRPLGASLPVPERLVAYETRIREYAELVERLGEAVERIETARNPDETAVGWGELRATWIRLEELRGRPFRRPARAPVIRIRP